MLTEEMNSILKSYKLPSGYYDIDALYANRRMPDPAEVKRFELGEIVEARRYVPGEGQVWVADRIISIYITSIDWERGAKWSYTLANGGYSEIRKPQNDIAPDVREALMQREPVYDGSNRVLSPITKEVFQFALAHNKALDESAETAAAERAQEILKKDDAAITDSEWHFLTTRGLARPFEIEGDDDRPGGIGYYRMVKQ